MIQVIGQIHLLENIPIFLRIYELYIQARDTNGNESEFVSFSFTILPPWYRTYAAYASYLILLAFGFRAFGKY